MSEAAKESKVKEPLTKEEKIRRILLITLSSIVAIVIIVGLFVGSPYSIEKNEYKSFETMMDEYYYRPTVVYVSRPGCRNCNTVKGGLSSLKDRYKGEVNFYHINMKDGGEGTELWEKGWRGSGSWRSRAGVSAGLDGTPGIVCFLARESKDADAIIYYISYGSNRTNADVVGKRIEKMLEKATELNAANAGGLV